MKNSFPLLLLAASLLAFFSCKKEVAVGDYRLVILSGDHQNGQPGEVLTNEIVVQALKPDGSPAFSHPIYFSASSGIAFSAQSPNWSLNVAATDEAGRVKIKWQLGCSGDHKMSISLRSPGCSQFEIVHETCLKLGSVEAKATSGGQTGWVKSCGISLQIGAISRQNTRFKQFGDDIFFVGGSTLFHSTDDGVNWRQVNSIFGPGSFTNFTDFTKMPSGKWVAADASLGVSVSTDRGETWKNISTPFNGFGVNFLFSNGSDLYAVAQFGGGFFVSHDDGESWEQMQVSNSTTNTYTHAAASPDGTTVFAFNEYIKLFKTTNGGSTWTPVGLNPNPSSSYQIRGLQVSEDNKLVFLSDFYTRIYEANLSGTGSYFSFSTSATGYEFGQLFRQGQKNWLLHFGDPFNLSDDQILSGTGQNYQPVDLKGFDKPLETFFITASGKLILTTTGAVFTYRD